jgi:hypothetical protein
MAPRKAATRKSTSTVKEAASQPEAVSVEGSPAGHEVRGRWAVLGCLSVILLFVVVPSCAGVSYVAWTKVSELVDGGDRIDDDRRDRPTDISREIDRADISAEHSLYFAKVCEAVANRMEVDGEVKDPVFTQRSEVADLIGAVGQLAVAGVNGVDYPDLPDIIETAFDDVWDRNDDGELQGGAFTERDRSSTVRAWRRLSDAFEEVAQ